ncbi:MAG: GyrI-like domain-containing protein [Saccharofermentanales bacterium]
MSEKVDYKKTFKELYAPRPDPAVVQVPSVRFALIEGSGNPNGEAFAQAVEALYSFSYTVKMSYRSQNVPAGYYEYTVFPLEGEWDLIDVTKPSTDKDNFKYRIMIRQPDFLDDKLFVRFLAEAKRKKPNESLDRLCLVDIHEGLCCQMLHLGSFDDEPASFERMVEFCAANGYRQASKMHREIYLSDPRKTEPSKLRTILRVQIEQR